MASSPAAASAGAATSSHPGPVPPMIRTMSAPPAASMVASADRSRSIATGSATTPPPRWTAAQTIGPLLSPAGLDRIDPATMIRTRGCRTIEARAKPPAASNSALSVDIIARHGSLNQHDAAGLVGLAVLERHHRVGLLGQRVTCRHGDQRRTERIIR